MKLTLSCLVMLAICVNTEARPRYIIPTTVCKCTYGHIGSINLVFYCNPPNECECKFPSGVCSCREGTLFRECDEDDCCTTGRRALMLQGDETEFHDLLDLCGDADYEGSLYVDSHLIAVAVPGKEANQAGCPIVATHAVFDDDSSAGRKEILVWDDLEDAQTDIGDFSKGSYSMGTFKLSQLATAFEEASPNSSGNTVYDTVTNNCGSFMVNFASKLGVKIDSKLTSFVTRRLIESSGKELAENIINNIHLGVLFPSEDGGRHLRREASDVTDDELVELLVDAHASKLS